MRIQLKTFFIMLLALGLPAELSAQSVAAFSSIKGDVTIRSGGIMSKARSSSKLKNGDHIKAGSSGKAVIIYYSGKEVVLRNNGSHKIRSSKSKKNSQASGLGKVVSDLLWGKEKSKSVAGTTRWQTADEDTTLSTVYPRRSKILESRPIFRWIDTIHGRSFTLTIESEVSDFFYTTQANGTWFAYPSNAPKLDSEDQYLWFISDSSGRQSAKVYFSIMGDEEHANLKQDILEVESLKPANGELVTTNFLLSAAYYRYNLFHSALDHAQQAAVSHPEMPGVYTILETLNTRLGNKSAAALNAREFAKVSVED
ncbi:MAG: tetratricopeptide repeat protein [Calditrichia bacterium]